MSINNSLKFNRPSLFSPTITRNIVGDQYEVPSFQKYNFNQFSSSSLGNSGSFKYEVGNGLKSSQQLNIDWSDFSQHCFYNSARVKVQTAFDKIINQFPFDGTREEYELFFDSLTGFEKYVYDRFPKHKGYLFFSGTNVGENGNVSGTFITTNDVAGTSYPTISKTITGNSILDPGSNSMTIEFQIFVPTTLNTDQVILQKISSSNGKNYGFNVGLKNTSSLNNTNIEFSIISGSYFLTASALIQKGQFNHISTIWNRTPGIQKLFFYVNQDLIITSSAAEINNLNCQSAKLYIGSGSNISSIGFSPTTTLSGALDELRIWHSIRTIEDRAEFERKSLFAQPELKLYYKFNEPSGSNSQLVIDHSNNSLHGILNSVAVNTYKVREVVTSSIIGSTPMIYEKSSLTPVLFAEHPDILELRETFLSQSFEFDNNNPNLILKLIPHHYLLEGQIQDATETEDSGIEGTIVDEYTSENKPRTGKLGDTQLLLSLLWTWAKFFDELKLYIQAFGDLYHVDYDETDTIPNEFIHLLAEKNGVKLPPLFTDTSIKQFIDAENLDNFINTNEYSLQYIQNQIWRRILINIKDILKSKGTIHSIKSFIRSTGIDPDNNFRIREFGGPTQKSLKESREFKSEISSMVNFISGGFMQSVYLSGSRIEPGWPYARNNSSDGLFTSGSWTYEGIYRYNPQLPVEQIQSLVRVNSTGSSNSSPRVLFNALAVSGSGLKLYLFPNSSSQAMSMELTGANIFDGGLWNVSFGRYRNDDIILTGSSNISSSYFFRAGKQNHGEIIEEYITSSFYNDESLLLNSNPLTNISSTFNASGTFITVGSQSISTTNFPYSSSLIIPTEIYQTNFQGKVGHIRFWSKGLELKEWREHIRNFKSIGVQNPLTNFNFTNNISGSFSKLRMDVSTDQYNTGSSNTGTILFTDFSQNNIVMSGTNFPQTSSIIVPQRFFYSHISPKFDQASTTNKVRARSFLNANNIIDGNNDSYVQEAPLYELEKSEQPTDDTRLSIEFSVADALDQDIINIFSTLDILDNAIGAPELLFAQDYKDLDNLRNVYFNRLTDQINIKSFFEFFKFFDTNMGQFIEQLIPRKTKYLGFNFCIEDHMLSRHKINYEQQVDMYIGTPIRHSNKVILLQLFIGSLQKY